ncbi:MAG TPA: flagellar hook-length control protein FliK [Myxococcaceae bacterium]|nr:flagellar hook-length control protein FliK [Myxococcaceae bacterium]
MFARRLKAHQGDADRAHAEESGLELEQGKTLDAQRKSKWSALRAAVAINLEGEQFDREQGRRGVAQREQGWQSEHVQSEAFTLGEHEGAERQEELLRSGRDADGEATRGELGGRRRDANARGQAQSDKASSAGGGGREAPKTKVGADGGGGKGKGGGSDSRDNEAAASFRLNPALMAPPPIAQPKETGASARLRALANEIAQKIVERVRVGVNASGEAEFQISLRSSVLSGLEIRVSGSRGRIKALFSGTDREVLKLLEERKGDLRRALEGRGLKLEELKIEVRA